MFSFGIVRKAIPIKEISDFRKQATEVHTIASSLLNQHGHLNVLRHLDSRISRFATTAASINLDALNQHDQLLATVQQATKDILEEHLHRPVCDIDLGWLRKQYPPSKRPIGQSPHSWHQDGACGLDLSEQTAEHQLTPMITVWIPLDDCGKYAPSIELIPDSPNRLLRPAELSDRSAQWRKRETKSIQMQAGDILILAEHCLHRTYVNEAMNQSRFCAEFRFLEEDSIPQQFVNHQFRKQKLT